MLFSQCYYRIVRAKHSDLRQQTHKPYSEKSLAKPKFGKKKCLHTDIYKNSFLKNSIACNQTMYNYFLYKTFISNIKMSVKII